LVSFDGQKWTNPIFVNHSDNLLDNRPALVSTEPGRLLMINSSDYRHDFQIGEVYSTVAAIAARRKQTRITTTVASFVPATPRRS
jgi:hypothetical protein